jgi:hypothetical protein
VKVISETDSAEEKEILYSSLSIQQCHLALDFSYPQVRLLSEYIARNCKSLKYTNCFSQGAHSFFFRSRLFGVQNIKNKFCMNILSIENVLTVFAL